MLAARHDGCGREWQGGRSHHKGDKWTHGDAQISEYEGQEKHLRKPLQHFCQVGLFADVTYDFSNTILDLLSGILSSRSSFDVLRRSTSSQNLPRRSANNIFN